VIFGHHSLEEVKLEESIWASQFGDGSNLIIQSQYKNTKLISTHYQFILISPKIKIHKHVTLSRKRHWDKSFNMYHSINPPLHFFQHEFNLTFWVMLLIGSLLKVVLIVNISSFLDQRSLHFCLSMCLLFHLLRNTYYSFIWTSIIFSLKCKN